MSIYIRFEHYEWFFLRIEFATVLNKRVILKNRINNLSKCSKNRLLFVFKSSLFALRKRIKLKVVF